MNIKFPIQQSDISDMLQQLDAEEKAILLRVKHITMQRELLQEACEHLDHDGNAQVCPSCRKEFAE